MTGGCLTLYVEQGLCLQQGARAGAGLAGPGARVPLLQRGHPQPAQRVRLQPPPLRVIARRQRVHRAPVRRPPPARTRHRARRRGCRGRRARDQDLLALEADELAVGAGHARVAPHDADGGVGGGGGELAAHHAPDLALPHPRVPGLEAGDEEAALAGVILGGGDAAVLPHAAAAHRVDGLVRGLPQADGGGDGGGALQPHRVARAGDDVGRVRGHSEARAPHSLQQGNG